MPELKILNNKEIKEILKLVEKQWGAKLKLDYGFLKNSKNRIFVINKDIAKIDTSKLRLNSAGMYFCEIDNKGIRLSIEGSQIIGPKAKNNIVELNEEETKKWFKGEDLEKNCDDCKGFVILKSTKIKDFRDTKNPKDFLVNKNDFLGTGKYSNGKILNYVGKTRRVNIL